jgi:D-sedoheptulose 7-phosphate isomerase
VTFADTYSDYARRLNLALTAGPVTAVSAFADALAAALDHRRQVFIAGNGGSAANAIHLANDFLYGIGKETGVGLRVEALSANASVLTCLGNDISFAEIFAQQLRVKASPGDVLLVLSGSGNSPNVVRALETGNAIGLRTFAILGFSGGRCRELAEVPIHFAVDDMQISEDLQMVVGHLCMQWVNRRLRHAEGARP